MTAVEIWESTDGGATWAVVDAPGVHADAHHLILKSYPQGATKNLLYVTTDGGAYQGYKYKDLDEYKWKWNQISKGVASTQFWSVDGLANGFVTGGTQDNGTISVGTGTLQGTDYTGGDGSTVAIDYTNPSFIYGSYQNCRVFRSRDAGPNLFELPYELADVSGADLARALDRSSPSAGCDCARIVATTDSTGPRGS
jgi:hypothetical protein